MPDFRSPLLGPCAAHPERQSSLDEAILESRQNVFFEPGSLLGQRAFSLEPGEGGVGGLLSVPQAISNLANIIVGVGVLSVPYALKQSGYSALLIMALVIYVTSTTGKWIGDSLEMVAKCKEAAAVPPSAWDFSFLAQLVLGGRAGALINIVTVLEVWLALVTFMVMNGGNAAVLWPHLSKAFTVPVTGAIATACCFVPQRVFSYLSVVSTLAMFVAAMALVASTSMLSQWAEPYEHLGKAALVQPWNIPRSVGIILFCFAGHPCFPAVKTSMLAPSRWDHCMDVSFLIAFVYYVSFGFLGYIVFGSGLSPTVTENLRGIKGALIFQNIAAGCFLLKVQLTVPLLLNAIAVALWPPEPGQPRWPPLRVVLLVAVSGWTMVVAVSLSDAVAILASLAGSLFVMTTSVLFPAVVHLRLSQRLGQAEPIAFLRYAEYCFVIAFGVIMAVLGTALAVRDLLA